MCTEWLESSVIVMAATCDEMSDACDDTTLSLITVDESI